MPRRAGRGLRPDSCLCWTGPEERDDGRGPPVGEKKGEKKRKRGEVDEPDWAKRKKEGKGKGKRARGRRRIGWRTRKRKEKEKREKEFYFAQKIR